MGLQIDHDGAAAATVFDAVIDEIPEHGLQPQFAAPHRDQAFPPIRQPVNQSYLPVPDFGGQFGQDRFHNIFAHIEGFFLSRFMVAVRQGPADEIFNQMNRILDPTGGFLDFYLWFSRSFPHTCPGL